MNATRANAIKRYDSIWRPYVFSKVVADVTYYSGNRTTLEIDGECYSEFEAGPNLRELADYVSSIAPTAQWIGLHSCQLVSFRK